MIHYTLNTGHSRISPRSEVRDSTITAMASMIRLGRNPIPIPGDYSVEVSSEGDGAIATIWNDKSPLVNFAVAPDDDVADALWPAIESLYLQITEQPIHRQLDWEVPRRPESTPWIAAVVIWSGAEEAYWIGDFERCFAWAWIEALK